MAHGQVRLWPPSAHGSGLGRSRLALRQRYGDSDPQGRGRFGVKLMSLPLALGATCLKPCPTRHLRHQPGTRVDGREGDSLTTKTGGSKAEPPPPCSHHCSRPPPGMAPLQEQKEGTRGWLGTGRRCEAA